MVELIEMELKENTNNFTPHLSMGSVQLLLGIFRKRCE